MKFPDNFEFFDADNRPFLVRYDYDRGEADWFDARAGVGSPGYDPYVVVTEVNFGDRWESPDNYPQLDMESIEAEIMERLADLERDEMAARDEAEYKYFLELQREEKLTSR